jgi:hypothetical protein
MMLSSLLFILIYKDSLQFESANQISFYLRSWACISSASQVLSGQVLHGTIA